MIIVKEAPLNGGTQTLHRFENGFGASVIRGPYSYGGPEGLFELGVLVWDGDKYDLTYETSVTSDVIGHLTEEEVNDILNQIEALE